MFCIPEWKYFREDLSTEPAAQLYVEWKIRDDNRIENLELWCKAQPAGQRVEDRITYYIEFLNTYGYKVAKE